MIKRKHIRFNADENTFVAVKVEDHNPIGGLAITEAKGGCSAVFILTDKFKAKDNCYIKVGKMDPIAAEVRWIKELDGDLVKVGFQYLE